MRRNTSVVTVEFENFWNWIEIYFCGDTFTLYTVQALPIYCVAFQNDTNINKSQKVVDITVELLLSITYSVRPESFSDLIYFLLNFTYRTNYFKNPVTVELIDNVNLEISVTNKFTL